MRLFASERIAKVMDRLGFEDGERIESPMISKSIERAQRKVEENNFGIRKRLLEYDDVMNYQREAIYARRRNAISGDKIEIDLRNMMLDASALFVEKNRNLPFEDFEVALMAMYSIDTGFDAEFYEKARREELEDRLTEHMMEVYKRRMDTLVEKLNPIVKEVFEKQGKLYQNIAIPVSDGIKQIGLSVNLEKAYNSDGREIAKTLSKNIILYQIDEHWKEHLREMDDLKQSVQNASYEQKDPVVVYKLESYNLFASMLETLNKDVLSFLFKAFVPLRETAEQRPQRAVQPRTDMSRMQAGRSDLAANAEQKAHTPVKVDKTIGRNDPCPCGSGKKYKNCHGKGLI